jgi:hypothetical protein
VIILDESDEEGDGVAPRRKRRQAEKAAEGDVEDTEVGFRYYTLVKEFLKHTSSYADGGIH